MRKTQRMAVLHAQVARYFRGVNGSQQVTDIFVRAIDKLFVFRLKITKN